MAVKGHSTILAVNSSNTHTGGSWTDVAGITEITPPTIKVSDDIDVTTMTSPDQFKQFEAGFAEGGEVEFGLLFDPTQATTLYGLFRQNRGFRITFSDDSKWLLDGYVNEFGTEVEREGIVSIKAKLKISGKPIFEA